MRSPWSGLLELPDAFWAACHEIVFLRPLAKACGTKFLSWMPRLVYVPIPLYLL